MAIVLVTWYLMLPPPVFPPVKDADGNYKVNVTAPLSQWLALKKLASEDACRAEKKKMPSYYKCIASNDPVLKPAAKPKAAPSTSTAGGAAGSHMQ